ELLPADGFPVQHLAQQVGIAVLEPVPVQHDRAAQTGEYLPAALEEADPGSPMTRHDRLEEDFQGELNDLLSFLVLGPFIGPRQAGQARVPAQSTEPGFDLGEGKDRIRPKTQAGFEDLQSMPTLPQKGDAAAQVAFPDVAQFEEPFLDLPF